MARLDVRVERGTGMDVGCKRDAYAAATGGLREIGAGAQRTVYADTRMRFVYKIEVLNPQGEPRYPGSNRAEYLAFSGDALRKRGMARYGSPVALYIVTLPDGTQVDVLAMPFRPSGAGEANPREYVKFNGLVRVAGLRDMHDANYRVTIGGRIKITDLGFGA